MTITKEQSDQMLEAAKPLMKWLSENCHPHCEARVESGTIVLSEGIATNCTEEFIKDQLP
jgi:hypothetical protein